MRCETRLAPVNVLWGMLHGGGRQDDAPLRQSGFRLEGLEIPTGVDDDRIDLDAVAFNPGTGELLAAECKSGRNLDPDQVRRLVGLDPLDVIEENGINLATDEAVLRPVVVADREHRERIVRGLEVAESEGVDVTGIGLLVYNQSGVQVDPDWPLGGSAADKFPHQYVEDLGYANLIKFDRESRADELQPAVEAELVAALTRQGDVVDLMELASAVVLQWEYLPGGQRNELLRNFDQAARSACEASPENFEYRGATKYRPHAQVRLLASPEDSDPRGRTQRYQAIERRFAADLVDGTGPSQDPLYEVLDQLDDDRATEALLEELPDGDGVDE